MKNSKLHNTILIIVIFLVSCLPDQGNRSQTSGETSIVSTLQHAPPTEQKIEITPAEQLPIQLPTGSIPAPHPLALSVDNVALSMKQANRFGTGTFSDFKFSPDGKFLVVSSSAGFYLYNAPSFELYKFIETSYGVDKFDVNSDSSLIVTASPGGGVEIWSIESGKLLRTISIDAGIAEFAFDGKGHIALLGYSSEVGIAKIHVYSLDLGSFILEKEVKTEPSYCNDPLTFKFTYTRLAICDYLLDMGTASENRIIDYPEFAGDAAFSMDGNRLFVIHRREITAFNFNSPGKQRSVSLQPKGGSGNFSPMSVAKNYIAFVDFDYNYVAIFDIQGNSIKDNIKFEGLIRSVAISPDGQTLAVGKYFESQQTVGYLPLGIEIIDMQTYSAKLTVGAGAITDVDSGIVTNEGRNSIYLVAVGGGNGTVRLLNAADGSVFQEFRLEEKHVVAVKFSPNQKMLAASTGNVTYIWDLETFERILRLKTPSSFQIAFSRDSQILYLMGECKITRLQLATARILDTTPAQESYCSYGDGTFPYTFTSDGKILIAEDRRGSFVVFDPYTGEIVVSIQDKVFYGVRIFSISPDNTHFSFDIYHDVILSPSKNSRPIFSTEGVRVYNYFYGEKILFSPVNNLLVSSLRSINGTTTLWNIRTGNPLRVLNSCCRINFTPDGRYLITEHGGIIRVWGIDP